MNIRGISFIMRGIPGSGKSTVARSLVSGGGIIHSTDDLRTKDGVYRFDPKETDFLRAQNFREFCESLGRGVSVVICDNTNVLRCEYAHYVEAAWRAGYVVVIIAMPHPSAEEAAARTIHEVPIDQIRRMLERWEA